MLALTRVFLHNWHRYSAQLIDVDGSLCLTGPDEADALAALDAIQLAIVGDPAQVRFRRSRYGFTYDVDSYARGRISDALWLRPAGSVSYVILELTDTRSGDKTSFGMCIEAGPRQQAPEHTFFILPEALNPASFVTTGRPLPRIELRPLLRNWRGASHFERAHDYQTELLKRLGGLDDDFLALFQRALAFRPVGHADEFAAAWLFDERPLDLGPLRRARERLGQLRLEAEGLERQRAALQAVVDHQNEFRRLSDLRDQQSALIALLRSAAAERRAAAAEKQISDLREQIAAARADLEALRAACAESEAQVREAERLQFENGVAHRRSILEWQARHAAQAADHVRDRWAGLQRQFQAEADHLRPLLNMPGLESDELAALGELLEEVDAATAPGGQAAGGPPPPALAAAIDSAAPKLASALKRADAERLRLAGQIENSRQQIAKLNQDLAGLSRPGPAVPPGVARMQDLLAPIVGKKPPLLYEFIDVPDPRWQKAVEAMLGPCRYHAVVSATWFEAAQQALSKARASEDLGDAGLHDPSEGYSRPAQPGSLAEKVTTIYPDLRAYLDALLGDVICCESADELRRYPRAITADAVVHSEWQVRPLPAAHYQPLVIGQHAGRLQAEARQREADQISRELLALNAALADLTARLHHAETVIGHVDHARALAALRAGLSAPLDERPARAEAAGYAAELRALDLVSLDELREAADELRAQLARQYHAKDETSLRLARLEVGLRSKQDELAAAGKALAECQQQEAAVRGEYPAAADAAQEMLPPLLSADDLAGALRAAGQREKDYDWQATAERARLGDSVSAFHAAFQPAVRAADPADERYVQMHRRLAEADLPRCQAQIASLEQDIDEELHDHILRPLRERLAEAGRALEVINEALAGIDLGGGTYHFRYEPAPDLGDFYDLILSSDQPGQDPAEALGRFYDALTAGGGAGDRLADYRRYLSYGIWRRGADGREVPLHPADHETQTAFYLAMAASFARAYRIRGEEDGRPTIRLVAVGDVFARMKPAQIGSALAAFGRLKLQVIAAAPLERCDELAPQMSTTAVLTAVEDTILVEPYRNFDAQLPSPDEGAG